jgi:hypothetical protein
LAGCLHLEIHLGIPIAIVQDNDVGGVKVDAQAPGPCGEQEDELLGALPVVLVDLGLSVLSGCIPCTDEDNLSNLDKLDSLQRREKAYKREGFCAF